MIAVLRLGGRALLTDPNVKTIDLKASAHRQVHLRSDKEPFNDKRVRQAMAWSSTAPPSSTAWSRHETDSATTPRSRRSTSTTTSRSRSASRTSSRPKLLADGRHAGRVRGRADHVGRFEIPDLAQLIQKDAKEAGSRSSSTSPTPAPTTATRSSASRRWLDSTMGSRSTATGRAQRVPLGAAARRHLEQRPLQEQEVRRPRQGLHRAVRPRPADAARPRRSRSCCSTSRRS